MKRINELLKKFRNEHSDFNKKLLHIVPHLQPYVKHRLHMAENTAIIPKNMYCSNGIIDDAIIKFASTYHNVVMDTLSTELKLFKIIDEIIDNLYIQEEWHQKNISISYVLNEELNQLNEKYTVEDDNDLIMLEDLNDICYHQNNKKKHLYIYNDMETQSINDIDNTPFISNKNSKQKSKGKFYNWLPYETSKIVDLFVYGKLNFNEIAIIKDIVTIHP